MKLLFFKTLFLQILTFSLSTALAIPLQKNHDDNFESLLTDTNSSYTFCGHFNWKRAHRDCRIHTKIEDFRHCHKQDLQNPLYQVSDTPSYQCFNTSTDKGKNIILDFLEKDKNHKGCINKRIRSLYGQIIQSQRFQELFQDYERMLGLKTKVSFSFDLSNKRSSIELVYGPPHGRPKSDPRPAVMLVNTTHISPQKDCSKINTKKIYRKLDTHLRTLTIRKVAQQKYDPSGFEKDPYLPDVEGYERQPASSTH